MHDAWKSSHHKRTFRGVRKCKNDNYNGQVLGILWHVSFVHSKSQNNQLFFGGGEGRGGVPSSISGPSFLSSSFLFTLTGGKGGGGSGAGGLQMGREEGRKPRQGGGGRRWRRRLTVLKVAFLAWVLLLLLLLLPFSWREDQGKKKFSTFFAGSRSCRERERERERGEREKGSRIKGTF